MKQNPGDVPFIVTDPATGKSWWAITDQIFQLRRNGQLAGLEFHPNKGAELAESLGLESVKEEAP